MLEGNYLVEKSMSLVWAKLTDYGTGELKILDTYLSRIDARKPESSRVIFTKKEYAELMGLDADIRASQLKMYTAKLLKNIVTIDLPDGRKGYAQYPLFHEAECEFDESIGQTVIRIDCHPKLKQVFFDIAENRYIKYQLKNTIALKSQYSVRLYSLLMARPFGWSVEVDELRERLNANNKAYTEFKRFNDLVIKKAVKEINEITNMDVEVEYIKQGRSVVRVKFNVSITPPELPGVIDMEPVSVETVEEEENLSLFGPAEKNAIDPLEFYSRALNDEFTREQVQVMVDLAVAHLPHDLTDLNEKQGWIYHYLESKYLLMKTDSNVEKPFYWLKSAVSKDYQPRSRTGRKEPVPAWMEKDREQAFDDRLKKDMDWLKKFSEQQKTVENDPDLKARADALRQSLSGEQV